MNVARIAELLPSAFLIAFLAAVESLLSAIVADRMIGGSHRSNAELIGQGAAKILSPLFGGLPATGAIARTATNVRAGGRTPVAGIVHSATILLISLAAAPLAGYLTMPALAGLLLSTAWLMSEPSRWRERMSLRPGDRALLFMTMILTVVSNLTIAIAIGTGAGLGCGCCAGTWSRHRGIRRIARSFSQSPRCMRTLRALQNMLSYSDTFVVYACHGIQTKRRERH